VAAEPKLSPLVIDRFLVGAHLCQTVPCIVVNKLDILEQNPELKAEAEELLTFYKSLGYTVLFTSARSDHGIKQLASLLKNLEPVHSAPPLIPGVEEKVEKMKNMQGVKRWPTSIMVGQSGTGKSSLLNRLIPGINLEARELSRIGRGRHTTSASSLFHIPTGGQIIDSPGFDNYFPVRTTHKIIEEAFIEFGAVAKNCKFNDCKHDKEPKCAIKEAATQGGIRQSRLDSYFYLVAMMDEFEKK